MQGREHPVLSSVPKGCLQVHSLGLMCGGTSFTCRVLNCNLECARRGKSPSTGVKLGQDIQAREENFRAEEGPSQHPSWEGLNRPDMDCTASGKTAVTVLSLSFLS